MEPANLLEESTPYLVAEPKDVLQILQDLCQEQAFVTMSLPGGQKILTVLLEVDVNAGHFFFDIGRTLEETRAVLGTTTIHFHSALNGVSIRFTTPTPVEMGFGGSSAFRAPLPTDMEYLQRREHYRSKVIRPGVCNAQLADGTAISLKMSDLSVGGVRLQSGTVTPDLLPVGMVLQHAELELFDLGKVSVTLEIASHQTIQYEGISTYQYGCHIRKLPRGKEAIVQKLVFSLELLNRPNTRARA